ncbi:hypothetical protein GGR54DRAFT_610163 [Hypoxylon sp. NC1633]|nr:hypothetical protein GGR54DRAFT_610163 [Hypoxylon sp. NC1633]
MPIRNPFTRERLLFESHRLAHAPQSDLNHTTMPSQSLSPMRTLFLIEGVMKLAGGLMFILSPKTPLGVAVAEPIPASALLLTRLLGTQTLTLGITLLLASARTPAAVSSRRIVYWTVFARDATLATVLAAQLCFGQNMDVLGFTPAGLRSWLTELMPFCLGHLWVLLARPQWF